MKLSRFAKGVSGVTKSEINRGMKDARISAEKIERQKRITAEIINAST